MPADRQRKGELRDGSRIEDDEVYAMPAIRPGRRRDAALAHTTPRPVPHPNPAARDEPDFMKVIDEILRKEVADGVISGADRKRLRFCMRSAILRELALKQGPTCHRCGNSWAARDQAEREAHRLRTALSTLSNADDPDAPMSRESCAMVAKQALGAPIVVTRA